jgi:hypothetical protein
MEKTLREALKKKEKKLTDSIITKMFQGYADATQKGVSKDSAFDGCINLAPLVSYDEYRDDGELSQYDNSPESKT